MAYQPQKTIKEYLSAIYDAVQNVRTLGAVRGVLNDLRVTPTGAVTVTGTVTAITASIGGLNSIQVVPANQNTVAVLSNINNITIS
jgi:hypothetical protein